MSRITFLLVIATVLANFNGCSNSQNVDEVLEQVAIMNDRGLHDQALNLLSKNEFMFVGNARAAYLEGVAYEQLGDSGRAIAAYTKCLEIEPGQTDALNNRAVVQGKDGNFEAAIADLNKALELNPTDGLAWMNLGLAHAELAEYDEAIQKYNRAFELTEDPHVSLERGKAQSATGNYQEAIADFSKAIETDPRFAAAFLERAMVHAKVKNNKEAMADIEKAEKLDRELSMSVLTQNLKATLQKDNAEINAIGQVRSWIESLGFETTSSSELSNELDFSASRLPVAGGTTPTDSEMRDENQLLPDRFDALVLIRNEKGDIVCDGGRALRIVKSSREQESDALKKCLFVVDFESALTPATSVIDGQLQSLVYADFDWQPSGSDFEPRVVALKISDTSGLQAKK